MRTLLLVLLLMAQAPSEPYPGQGEHAKPPEGWMCEPQNYDLSVPRDHVCSCERTQNENGAIMEDKQCTVWCHMDHCKCPVTNQDAPSGDDNPFTPDTPR